MSTAQDYLGLFYPYLSDPADRRFVQPEQQAFALEAGVAFRPKCLSDDLQNQAQAHYAAYLLAARFATKAGTASRPSLVEQEQEGDVIIKYASGAAAQTAASFGPQTPYDAYKTLARRCTRGAILTRFS